MARIKLAADFRDFLKLCLRHEVEFMVVGGYAVVHFSRPRYTGDLDVPFISLDDLRKNKRASGRTKDLQDLEEL